RSRFARVGLGVHVTAGFIQPGSDNYPVLEMTNLGPVPLSIKPGVKVCQFIFQRCDGEAKHDGKFVNQIKP
ncbi:MAG: dCTP deaminase, partial [Candidatus Paceibacterota bacterium]